MLTPIAPHNIHTNGTAECSLVTIDRSPKCVKALCAIPVYSEIDFPRLLERQIPHRLILLCEDDFFPLQLADILRENGICSSVFREVGREGLVGQYVGETSIKVEKLFNEVRGGVLFIDEAGASFRWTGCLCQGEH